MPAKGENGKKAAGNAKKAEVAAQKKATEEAKRDQADSAEWKKGQKDNSKAAAAAEKAAEAARKKAEKEALLREEEASLPSKPTSKSKQPTKKSRGLDLSALDGGPTSKKELSALNASGIDNALDALNLTSDNKEKIDRHPERRFKAAYAQFEDRRLEEMQNEKGLRRAQKIELIRKEFEKHPDNPFNQLAATYNMTKEDVHALRESENTKKESLLSS